MEYSQGGETSESDRENANQELTEHTIKASGSKNGDPASIQEFIVPEQTASAPKRGRPKKVNRKEKEHQKRNTRLLSRKRLRSDEKLRSSKKHIMDDSEGQAQSTVTEAYLSTNSDLNTDSDSRVMEHILDRYTEKLMDKMVKLNDETTEQISKLRTDIGFVRI